MGLGGAAGYAGILAARGALGGMGVGAATSLLITGFLLDLALYNARPGWVVYLRLVLAALAANLVAFAIRAAAKALGFGGGGGGGGGKSLEQWGLWALVTYPVCGGLAGLLSAAVWFRFAPRASSDTSDVPPSDA
jgi:hypothetical protein